MFFWGCFQHHSSGWQVWPLGSAFPNYAALLFLFSEKKNKKASTGGNADSDSNCNKDHSFYWVSTVSLFLCRALCVAHSISSSSQPCVVMMLLHPFYRWEGWGFKKNWWVLGQNSSPDKRPCNFIQSDQGSYPTSIALAGVSDTSLQFSEPRFLFFFMVKIEKLILINTGRIIWDKADKSSTAISGT